MSPSLSPTSPKGPGCNPGVSQNGTPVKVQTVLRGAVFEVARIGDIPTRLESNIELSAIDTAHHPPQSCALFLAWGIPFAGRGLVLIASIASSAGRKCWENGNDGVSKGSPLFNDLIGHCLRLRECRP